MMIESHAYHDQFGVYTFDAAVHLAVAATITLPCFIVKFKSSIRSVHIVTEFLHTCLSHALHLVSLIRDAAYVNICIH